MRAFDRIVTHNDLDGVVSAAIASRALGIDRFTFTSPKAIEESRFHISTRDVVCDLPYPLECGMWFDHHEGNLEGVRLRKLDPAAIPGQFEPAESCAAVVYRYFKEKEKVMLPDFFATAVAECNIIDSFKYASIEEWRAERPGRILDCAIKAQDEEPRERDHFLRRLVRLLREHPIEEASAWPEVMASYKRFGIQEERMIETLRKEARFLEGDDQKEIIILDFTSYSHPPRILKNLVFLIYPSAKAVLEIRTLIRGGRRSTDLAVSMSLGVGVGGQGGAQSAKNVGEIMRELNIGDGHPGAGAGTIRASTKAAMVKAKEELLRSVLKLWKDQDTLSQR